MPPALPFSLREQIIQLHQSGLSLVQVAQQLHLKYRTVRALWRRYCEHGSAGLQTHYDRCGPPRSLYPQPLYQAALALKQTHPRWGAGLIRLQLAPPFPGQRLPHRSTLQRWFAAAGLQPARAQQPPVPRRRAQVVHEVWELDAKERLRLRDGSGASVLLVADEASGALLAGAVFPPV